MGLASTNAPTATTGDLWALSISPTSGGVRIDLKDTASNTNPFLVAGAGAAGSASGGILTVQGVASMTPILATVSQGTSSNLKAQVDPLTIATWGLAASTQNVSSPTNAGLVAGQFNTTPTTITTGNVSPLQLDSAGNLLVNVKAGGGSGGTSSSFSATFPSTGTAAGAEYLSSPPSLTTGQMVALQVTSAGSLHTTVDNTNPNGSAVSASSSPVVIASDQGAVAIKAASASIASGAMVDMVTNSATTTHTCSTAGFSQLGCLGQIDDDVKGAVAAGTNRIGYTTDDPCTNKTKKSIALSTGTSGTQLFAGTSSTNNYICSVSVIASAAANFSIVVGSGSSVCTGGTPLALIGSTTASSGMALAANGGLTLGNGGASIANDVAAAAQGYNVCIGINGTSTLAGNVTYVQQ
jgi:hypothetical protein